MLLALNPKSADTSGGDGLGRGPRREAGSGGVAGIDAVTTMISGVSRAFSDDIAIDLGTANTLVHVVGRGIIIDEPSVVAVQVRGGKRVVLAVGLKAKAMQGKTPEPIEMVRPMRDGVIADFIATEEMLRQFISRAKAMLGFRRPRILICVPAGATPVERRAVYETAVSAGARKVYLIEEPVAASLGAGLPIDGPAAFMVVDIGGGTTDIAVLWKGHVVQARSLQGGRQRHGRGHHALRAAPARPRHRREQRRAHQDRGGHGAGAAQRAARRDPHQGPRPARGPLQDASCWASATWPRRCPGRSARWPSSSSARSRT